jgi:hypothetical protein
VTDTAPVYVQDGSFFVSDSGVATPFETMDYSTGLAGMMESPALIYAGVDRGTVTVGVDAVDSPPALDTPQRWAAALAEWDDVAEVTLYVPNGDLRVDRLEYAPGEPRVDLPRLSSFGPGHCRMRIHASGRDRHHDKVVEDSGESFYLVTWPQPPAPPLIIKATSWLCGYGLRLGQISKPTPAAPTESASEQDDDAAHQDMLRREDILRRNLGGGQLARTASRTA